MEIFSLKPFDKNLYQDTITKIVEIFPDYLGGHYDDVESTLILQFTNDKTDEELANAMGVAVAYATSKIQKETIRKKVEEAMNFGNNLIYYEI